MNCFKKLFFLIIALITIAQISIAVESDPVRITLKSGEVYSGEIVLQNEKIILIRTTSGERFQFPVFQVKDITKITDKSEEIQRNDNSSNEILPYQSKHNFCSIFDVSGGASSGKNCFSNSTSGDITLSFGTRSIAGNSLFFGGGAGFSIINNRSTNEMLRFIPVYMRFQSNNLIRWRTSPYLSLDAGYAFPIENTMSGGLFAKLSCGIIHRLSFKTSIQFGIFARIQNFYGNLSEIRNGSIYTYSGNSSINSFGALAGFQF
jgi:hypothetical protein